MIKHLEILNTAVSLLDHRIGRPFLSFVSSLKKTTYTCHITTYDAGRSVTEPRQ